MTGHCLPAVVAIGEIRVVRAARQADVRQAVVSAKAERAPMVEFEPVACRTATTLRVHVAASIFIALTHRAADGGGDVARGG